VHAQEKGALTKEKKPHFKILIVSFFSILCRQRAERGPHLSSFLGALIFDWARAHDKKPLYLKEKETTIIELLCLVPTRRVGALIFPWRPAVARVLRERHPHLCSLPWYHDGSGRGTVLAPCAEGNIIFFSLRAHKKAFFPARVEATSSSC
jgi:hypothetical protein